MEFPQKESDQGGTHESKLLSYTWLVITPSHTHCLEPGVKRELMDLWPVINQNPRKTKGFLQLRDSWSIGEHCRDGSLGQTGKVNIRFWAVGGQSLETETIGLRQ